MTISVVNVTQLTALSGTIATTTSGNCLAVCIMAYSSNSSAPSVTGITLGGSANNFASAVYNNANINEAVFIWVDPDCNGGQTALAVSGTNFTSATLDGLVVFEISGLVASSVTDKTNDGNGSSTSWSSGSTGTLSQTAEIIIGCMDTANTPTAPGSPWTGYETAGQCYAAYQVVSATTAVTYNSTQSTSGPWGAAIVSLLGQTSTNATVTGVLGTIAVTAPAGHPGVGPTGVTGAISVAAPAGSVTLTGGFTVAGALGTIAVTAPAGAAAVGPSVPSPGQITVAAPAGGLFCHLSAVTFTPTLLQLPQTSRRTISPRTGRRGVPRRSGQTQHLERLGIPQPAPAITWNVRRTVTAASPAITWNVRKAVAATAGTLWETRGLISAPPLHVILRGSEKHAAAGVPRRRRRASMPGGVSRQSRLLLPVSGPIRWNTHGGISKLATVTWNTTTRVSADAYCQWGSVDGAVTVNFATAWNTDCQVVWVPPYPDIEDEGGGLIEDEGGGFILGEGPVSNVTWNTRQRISGTAAISWTTYGHEKKFWHISWNTLVKVSSSPAATLKWNSLRGVSSGPQPVTTSIYPAVRHTTAARPGRRRMHPLAASIAQHTTHLVIAGNQPGVTWNTLARVSASASMTWNTGQRVNAPTARTQWDTIATLPITRHHLVTTRSRATLRRRHRRGLLPAAGSAQQVTRLQVPLAAGQTAQVQWDIRRAVTSNTASTTWNTLKHVVTSSGTIAWNTEFRLHQQGTAKWETVQRTSKSTQVNWNITPTVSTLLLPRVIPQAVRHTTSRQPKFKRGHLHTSGYSQHTDRIIVPPVPAPIAWNIRTRLSASSDTIQWGVTSRISSTVAVTTWGVIQIIDPGVRMQWETLVAVVAVTPSVQWNVGQPLQGDMRLASMDEWFTPE